MKTFKKSTMKILTTFIILATVSASAFGCNKNTDNSDLTGSSPQSTSVNEESTYGETTNMEEETDKNLKEDAGAATDTILYAEDFGAKGDGITDDGPAITDAVNKAIEEQATLKFGENKKYYIASSENNSSGFTSPFAISDSSKITVDGNGSTFVCAPGIRYFVLTDCSDIKIINCNFDMSVPVYMVGKVTSVNGSLVTYATDINPYTDSFDFSSVNGFSIKYNKGIQNRPHMFMGEMNKIGEKTVTVEYNGTPGYGVGDLVFLPNPGIGHCIGEMIYIGGCENALLFENIRICSAPSFTFAIKSNSAEIFFENTDISPAQDNDREIKMVAWRDGYHCKDNRGGIHWNNCQTDVIFDDVFNISGTLGYITGVANDSAVYVTNYEHYSIGQKLAFDCQKGDIVDIYDIKNNRYYGCVTVRSAEVNPDGTTKLVFDYGQTIPDLKEGCVVANRNTCAPGSTVTDCKFTGTFRFLRDLRVENTVFDMLATWMMVEGGVEGPLPGNVDFIDCTFNGGTIEIDAYNRELSKYLKKIGEKIENIGFWGCEFNDGCKIISRTGSNYTVAESYTEEDLFTEKNKDNKILPVEITPLYEDFENTVTYDWYWHTMNTVGADVITADEIENDDIKVKILSSGNFSDKLLKASSQSESTVELCGLSKQTLDYFHDDGKEYIISFDYFSNGLTGSVYAASDTEKQLIGEDVVKTGVNIQSVSVIYRASSENNKIIMEFKGSGEVFIGNINISLYSNKNPSAEQLGEGHTFVWNDEVTIGNKSEAVKISDIDDVKVRDAILANRQKFSDTVLHVGGELGEFTGFTDPSFYIQGKTYKLSIDAYIASEMIQADGGTNIYLMVLDGTAGNRILAEGLFEGSGLYHFETDWTVGNTGEYRISFYINNAPKKYADIYIGNFTVTAAKSQKPEEFEHRDDFKTPSHEELQKGYTFDFTENNVLNTGNDSYASLSSLDPETAEMLRNHGFGETVYYMTENLNMLSLDNIMSPGKSYKIVLEIYDVRGNLASSGARGAFVLLNMANGVQNGAEQNYTVDKDPENGRFLTLTFNTTPPDGTDRFLLYQILSCEFFIGSVTIQEY